MQYIIQYIFDNIAFQFYVTVQTAWHRMSPNCCGLVLEYRWLKRFLPGTEDSGKVDLA